MTVQTVKLAGQDFVILKKRDFEKLRAQVEQQAKQDEGDVAEARRRKAAGPSRSYAQLRKRLGLK